MLTLNQDQADVIRSLPSLFFPFQRSLRTLTFLVTPEFLHWFDEGNGFVQNALEHVYQDWSTSMQEQSNPGLSKEYKHIVESRVAVVDRIPFPEGKSAGYPGISLALEPKRDTWPSARSCLMRGSADPAASTEGPLISVNMSLPEKHGEDRRSRILLRPANTLFINGLRSTMFVERWELTGETTNGRKVLRQGARQYVDHVMFSHAFQSSSLKLPLRKLTEKGEISMCMGNVISKLVGNRDSDPISASHELEGNVSAFMKSRSATSGILAVFALIIPKPGARGEIILRQAMSTKLFGYGTRAGVDDVTSEDQRTLDSIRLAISNGAHLHRVTSGGGGWGKKKGLLSLEPAMGFANEESGVTSRSASEDLDDKTGETGPFWATNSAAEIARPGDMIEFYGIFLSKKEEQALTRKESLLTALKVPDTRQWQNRTWAKEELSNIVLGVIPPQDSHNPGTVSTLGNELITIPHQFGMLSENGVVLQTVDQEIDKTAPARFTAVDKRTTNITKIDAPHTVLTYSVLNRTAIRVDPEVNAASEVNHNILRRKVNRDGRTQQEIIHHNDIENSSSEQRASTPCQEETNSSPADKIDLDGGLSAASRGGTSQRTERRVDRTDKLHVRFVKHTPRLIIKKHYARNWRRSTSPNQRPTGFSLK
jgi:hypothetical protein